MPADIAPNASVRLRPLQKTGTMPRTDGVTRLAPTPTTRRPAHENTAMLGAHTKTASPSTARARPKRNVRRIPTTTPTMPPAIMNAPATHAYTVVASWTSAMVASREDTSSAAASPTSPLSHDVPIWAITNTARKAGEPWPPPSPAFVATPARRIP